MWLLSHLHLIMVVGGLFMGAVGLAIAVGCGVCYSVKKNNAKQSGESIEQYQPIVQEDEVNASHAETEAAAAGNE